MTPSVTESITLPVLGMTCASCQHHVEYALSSISGVKTARVDLLGNRASVEFDPAVATPERLLESIRSAGYDAVLPHIDAVPTHPAAENGGKAAERKGSARKAWAMLAAGAVVMVLSMPLDTNPGPMDGLLQALAPWLYSLPADLLRWGLLALTASVAAWAGSEIYRNAWSALKRRATNMNTLVSLGTIAAFAWSAYATMFPSPERQVYFDAVLLIIGFLLLGKSVEGRARRHGRAALDTLALLRPMTARRVLEGIDVMVPLEEIEPGDSILVLPGELFPVDAVIQEGRTSVDESMLTGEPSPVTRDEGDRVLAGTLNYENEVTCQAKALGEKTVLAQMARMVEQAQNSHAPLERFAARASEIFVPAALALATITFVVWMVAAHSPALAMANAVAVLVVACPCAMGLAVPAALTMALARGAQLGVLFKGGEALQRLAHLNAIVLDKTGTLTAGRPMLSCVRSLTPRLVNELVRIAAAAEEHSNHALAHAIISHARMLGLPWEPAENLQVYPGRGLSATVEGQECLLGNETLFREFFIPLPKMRKPSPGVTRLWMALDNTTVGFFDARDALRPDAAEAIAELRGMAAGKADMRVLMLTGDTLTAAAPIAEQAGITEVEAGLEPVAKLARIRQLQKSGLRVAMVGDGINDAAALAQADAGISMGSGADMATEAGDVLLLRAEPLAIPEALGLSRATVTVMRQNLALAAGFPLIGLPLAAGVFYPGFHLLLTPWLAGAAVALSSACVLANSLRLRNWEPAAIDAGA